MQLTVCVCVSLQQKSEFSMFSSAEYNGNNLLFSDTSTTFIQPGNENYMEWMGRYYHMLRAMDCTKSGVNLCVFLKRLKNGLFSFSNILCLNLFLCDVCYIDVPSRLRWCVLSNGEQQKCADMAVAFKSKNLIPDIQCVYGTSVEDCLKKVQVCQSAVI